MTEQPATTPLCCGQPAKWVDAMPNLAYFYCEKCKNEVGGKDDTQLSFDFTYNNSGTADLKLGTEPVQRPDDVPALPRPSHQLCPILGTHRKPLVPRPYYLRSSEE
jgi:hypothetical protein